MALEAGRAFLQQVDENGVSLHGHITEVLARVLTAKPEKALDALESISLDTKAAAFTTASAAAPPEPSAELEPPSEWVTKTSALLAVPTGDAEGEEPNADLSLPNIVEEMSFFEQSGVGLSREETHRVFISIYKLQQAKTLTSARFFGKILGTNKDYYVVEAKPSEDPAAEEPEEGAPPPPVPPEPYGTGCNTFVYYVTNDVSGEWTELPLVKPEQLSAAMRIRKLFTGDLGADVRAYPPFPGKEKEYLRAQIARIWACTTLCPKGKFEFDPEADPKEPGELPFGVKAPEDGAYMPLPAAAMLAPENWLCCYMRVLAIGRCTNPPKEEEEEEEDPDAPPKPKGPEPEKETPALTPGSEAEWGTQLFSRLGAGSAVAVARSLKWPGAFAAAVMKEDKYQNLYIGYGHEAFPPASPAAPATPFRPLAPPAIEAEPDDVGEQTDMPLAEENAAFKAKAEQELKEAPDEEPPAEE